MAKASKIIDLLLEAPMDTGDYADFIEPGIAKKFATRSHPMAKNPAYPKYTPAPGRKPTNWEEEVGGEQYQDTLKRITTFVNRLKPDRGNSPVTKRDLPVLMQLVQKAVGECVALESANKGKLEKLALQLLWEQPEFEEAKKAWQRGDFKIDAKLDSPDLGRAELSPEEEDEATENEEVPQPEPEEQEDNVIEPLEGQALVAKAKDYSPAIQKRRVLSALVHGAAVSKNYSYQMLADELNAISPKLLDYYGVVMAFTELGYFIFPQQAIRQSAKNPDAQVGSSEVLGGEKEGATPIVKARGVIFPVLMQELTKGMMEMIAMASTEDDAQEEWDERKETYEKTDFVDEETWQMIMGRAMWKKFVAALGGDHDDITMHLYNRIAAMPAFQFNDTMQAIHTGGAKAQSVMKKLGQEVRADMEAYDNGEFKGGPPKE